MCQDNQGPTCSEAGENFHIVQPLRDLESNWAIDLAKNLEEYLLKIYSGEITGKVDGHLSVNFAEGSILFLLLFVTVFYQGAEFEILCFEGKCSCFAASGFNSGVQSESGVSAFFGFTSFGVYFAEEV